MNQGTRKSGIDAIGKCSPGVRILVSSYKTEPDLIDVLELCLIFRKAGQQK